MKLYRDGDFAILASVEDAKPTWAEISHLDIPPDDIVRVMGMREYGEVGLTGVIGLYGYNCHLIVCGRGIMRRRLPFDEFLHLCITIMEKRCLDITGPYVLRRDTDMNMGPIEGRWSAIKHDLYFELESDFLMASLC